jgi:hypothetical protein
MKPRQPLDEVVSMAGFMVRNSMDNLIRVLHSSKQFLESIRLKRRGDAAPL